MLQGETMHIVNYSMGKDSTAMLILMLKHNMKIDEILWADLGEWAEFTETFFFKSKVEETLNIRIKTVSSDKWTWRDIFYSHPVRGKTDKIRGFPPTVGAGCRYRSWLKTDVLESARGNGNDIYIGIAADEAYRAAAKAYMEDKSNRYHFPLIEWGITEKMCRNICLQYDLLHPLYRYFKRLGCWNCPKQSIASLRVLRKRFPGYWSALSKLQADCPWDFSASGSVEKLEQKFLEEEHSGELKLIFEDYAILEGTQFYKGDQVKMAKDEWDSFYTIEAPYEILISEYEILELGNGIYRYIGGRKSLEELYDGLL